MCWGFSYNTDTFNLIALSACHITATGLFVINNWGHTPIDSWFLGHVRLDFTTLEKGPDDDISDDLRRRADDVVWGIRVEGEWLYLYIVIEFQSTVDRWTAVRVMTYVGLLNHFCDLD